MMTTAQVAVAAAAASGSGSALLTARRVPAHSATASSPRRREGGADGRGWDRARAPPARPGAEGHPSFPTLPTALLAPGTCLGAGARAQNRRAQRTRRSDWGGPPAARAKAWGSEPAVPSLRAAGQGTRPPAPPFLPWPNGNSNFFRVRECWRIRRHDLIYRPGKVRAQSAPREWHLVNPGG